MNVTVWLYVNTAGSVGTVVVFVVSGVVGIIVGMAVGGVVSGAIGNIVNGFSVSDGAITVSSTAAIVMLTVHITHSIRTISRLSSFFLTVSLPLL